jgi:hypothetical protein
MTWNLSPNIGAIDKDGKYRAPEEFDEDTSIKLTAIDSTSGNRAEASITLVPPAWRGVGASLLGFYIVLVFFTVFLLIGLWPLGPANAEPGKAARSDAPTAQTNSDLKVAAGPLAPHNTEPPKSPPSNVTAREEGKTTSSSVSTPAAETATKTAPVEQQQALGKRAEDDLAQKKNEEAGANGLVQTILSTSINREVDLLLLVLLAGMLGAFLHLAQSYSYFTGNRALKRSWLWWYLLQPFIGGGLAIVFYGVLRGGLVSVVLATGAKTSDLNTCGVIALSALVGLFSKAATSKLGDVFQTLFQNEAAGKAKDKVDNGAKQPPANVGAGAQNPKP